MTVYPKNKIKFIAHNSNYTTSISHFENVPSKPLFPKTKKQQIKKDSTLSKLK